MLWSRPASEIANNAMLEAFKIVVDRLRWAWSQFLSSGKDHAIPAKGKCSMGHLDCQQLEEAVACRKDNARARTLLMKLRMQPRLAPSARYLMCLEQGACFQTRAHSVYSLSNLRCKDIYGPRLYLSLSILASDVSSQLYDSVSGC